MLTSPGIAVLAAAVATAAAAESLGGGKARANGPRMALVRVATKSPASFEGSFKPFSITFPDQADPKSFTGRATVDIEILPNGTVGKVKLIKSTGLPEVDEQVQQGIRKWEFKKVKQKLFLYLTLLIEIR